MYNLLEIKKIDFVYILYTNNIVLYCIVLTNCGNKCFQCFFFNAWCDLWGMKLNASKTKSMIVFRSRTMHPQSPQLTIDGTVLKESDDLDILGVTFVSKLTFEASSLGLQSSFSKTWYLEEVLAGIP